MRNFIKFATLWLSLSFMSSVALATTNVPTAELNGEECDHLEFITTCFILGKISESLSPATQKSCEERREKYAQTTIKSLALYLKVSGVVTSHYETPINTCVEQAKTSTDSILCFKKYSQLTHDTFCKGIQAPSLQGEKNTQIERKELPE